MELFIYFLKEILIAFLHSRRRKIYKIVATLSTVQLSDHVIQHAVDFVSLSENNILVVLAIVNLETIHIALTFLSFGANPVFQLFFFSYMLSRASSSNS